MIFLYRRSEPPALSANRQQWTERWKKLKAGGRSDWATRRVKALIGSALGELAYNKCAYCEDILGRTSYVEIEHYHPKSQYPDRAFEWSNLFPVCRSCNSAKGEEVHNGALLKPDDEDPEPFFWINNDSGRLEPHPSLRGVRRFRASETIRILQLNRPALCQARRDCLEVLGEALEHFTSSGGSLDELKRFLRPRMEFKFVIRWHLERTGFAWMAVWDRDMFRAESAGK